MNRKERVLMAIAHQEPDYPPYNFHATASVYHKVQEYYDLSDVDAVVRFVGNHIVKIGSDFNVNPWQKGIDVKQIPSGGAFSTSDDTEGTLHTDEFGCIWDRRKGLPHPIGHPLADDYHLLDTYRFPDPWHQGRFDTPRAMAEKYKGDVFVFGKLGMALFERAWSIRGMQELLMDMALRPEFVEELLDRILYEWDLPVIEQQLNIGVDGFYFADDWGSKTSLLFSKGMWQRFIKPRLAVCYQAVKDAGAFVGQHSDGNILEIVPDLIEIGLDILNPVQPSVYDPEFVKTKYGDKLTLYGAIDVETTLPFGSPDDVRSEIKNRAKVLGKDGGYILQSSHTMMTDVPIENLVAYIETCHELAGIDTLSAAQKSRGR